VTPLSTQKKRKKRDVCFVAWLVPEAKDAQAVTGPENYFAATFISHHARYQTKK
jgi:hypothetical protein